MKTATKSTTVSSKGQITIPAAMRRELELTPGTKLEVIPVDGAIVLMREPASLAVELAGSMAGVYGDAVDYVNELRDEWD